MSAARLQRRKRRGAIAVFAAMLMTTIIAMVAFAIDYGFILKKRSELQRAADAAALAAVRDIVPSADGTHDLAAARATVRAYATQNLYDPNFTVLDSDIEFGRYDATTVYSNFTILSTGVYDTVRVRLRRDSQANGPVSLFFARVLGINTCSMHATGTAVLQKASIIEPGVGILPIAIPKDEWRYPNPGDVWAIYGDGSIVDDSGNVVNGNWGTVDIGDDNNSTAAIVDQVLNGLRQSDLDALYEEYRIPTNTHIDSLVPFDANAETGFSTGMKHAINDVIGEKRLIPLYDDVGGGGNGAEFHIVGWGVAEVVGAYWRGSKLSHVDIKKSYTYDRLLKPQTDLTIAVDVIEGAFTSPVLVE